LYASLNVFKVMNSRRMRCGHVARMGELVGKPEGKIPLGRPTRRWESIKMDLREVGWEGVDRIYQTQNRDQWRGVVNTVMNLRFP